MRNTKKTTDPWKRGLVGTGRVAKVLFRPTVVSCDSLRLGEIVNNKERICNSSFSDYGPSSQRCELSRFPWIPSLPAINDQECHLSSSAARDTIVRHCCCLQALVERSLRG
jgi:hypothetical protein